MSSRKDRKSAKAVEQDFPHFVEVLVPPGGLGTRLNAMYDFHVRHSIPAKRGYGQRGGSGGSVIRWCFADPKIAAEFAAAFAQSPAGSQS
jgi:hypothetical protein